ncbi:glycosyltransferase family 2 protein [Thermonema rossianum]|uniref:glycosyltransferase family 2 protein n=1 Tax=Thermonema rossianum TaxID=55505 RepID=UPI0006918A42|nr:glycosyltransferase family 2 protein [Thermonema rossianum]
MQKKVAIVVLNHNGLHWLKTFLPLVCARSPQADCWVVDNGSTDGSLAWLRQHMPEVACVALGKNYGFCEGYNRGIGALPKQYDYFILLNSDACPAEGWLAPMIDLMDACPRIAACQPKVLRYNPEAENPFTSEFEYAGAAGGFIDRYGYPFCRGRLFNTCEIDRGQYDSPAPVAWATGACLCVRAADWEQMGGFDPLFFAHMEEIDLCLRLWANGRSVYCVPASVVYHVGGGTLHKQNPQKTYLNFRNSLFLLYKHLPPRQKQWQIFLRLLADAPAALALSVQSCDLRHLWAVIKAHRSFYAHKKRLRVVSPSAWQKVTYPGSIVWNYFARKKRRFSDLCWQLPFPEKQSTAPTQKTT